MTKWFKHDAQRMPDWKSLDESCPMGEFRVKTAGQGVRGRFVVVRERLRESRNRLGRKLFEVPG